MSKLSIIICCFNKWAFTENCIKDLSFLDPDLNEIIIYDNGSSDQTNQEIQKWVKKLSNLVYLRSDTNLGFAGGNNQAYKASKGNYILFMNNDIRVGNQHSLWTDIIMQSLEEAPNTLIGASGGFIDPKKEFQFCYEAHGSANTKPINYVSGWLMAGTKTNLDKLILEGDVGPFSTKFLAYYEDVDLSWRAQKLGMQYKIIDVPVCHFGKITSKQLNVKKLYNDSRIIFTDQWRHHIKG
jgi:GT2 family glycosyltransferase